ncbi:MAG: UDP-N-acetylmuramate dehydrogenase [Streptococcaceae bacterium]|jgi:UDP-N-acetylmuramate dehydrogenase|nr:UDP-N-acetylmuramate dehydrogenase [Streptococcaceae bacterium]
MLDKENLKNFDVKFDEALSNYTYTRVGGPADILVFPRSIDELAEIVRLAHAFETSLTVLGNASNLIVRDGGIRGLVVLLDHLDNIAVKGLTVGSEQNGTSFEIAAEAGAKLKGLTQYAQEQSLTGFEFACGIPGSVGGAVFMNAGAYGGEIKDVLSTATVMNPQTGEISVLKNVELNFAYRTSIIKEEGWIVLSATFRLELGDRESIQARMDDLNAQRASKQPLEYPSCGSVFKRPEGHFAGRLIQEAGCVGKRIGGIEVSKKHAGFMVNVDHGTAKDYENLIMYVIEKVKENSGVTLEPEVRIIGEE